MKKTLLMLLISISVFAGKIEVIGNGVVNSEPNIININLGIQTQKETVQEAMNTNQKLISQLYEKLKMLGIDKKDIVTSQFYLNYYVDEKKNNVYTVNNNLEIKVRDLEKINVVLAISTESGVNNIRGITFVSDNTEELSKAARLAAVKDAKQKATEYAKASGQILGKAIEIVEIQNYNSGFETRTKSMAFAGDMVYGPSELAYTQSVRVVFELK